MGSRPEGRTESRPNLLEDLKSPEALRLWCILAGLALAPLPAFHALPDGFLYHLYNLYELPPPGWVRLRKTEILNFTLVGLPLAPIFVAWALPGTRRPGVPLRSIAFLCLLAAYHPYRLHIETDIYGATLGRLVTEISQGWPVLWLIEHLDTPLLIGLATTAVRRRHTLRPLWKVLFHWGLFVCALWAAGPLYDSMFHWVVVYRAFGI